jgi:hypothetical protein
MLEILILIRLGQGIANRARAKGRSGGLFVVLLLFLWFGGEICGGIAGAVVGMVAMGQDEPALVVCYLGALAGAAVGAVIAFAVVNGVAPVRKHDEYDDEDEYEDYDRPARKRDRDRDREDDERY